MKNVTIFICNTCGLCIEIPTDIDFMECDGTGIITGGHGVPLYYHCTCDEYALLLRLDKLR